MILIYQLGTLDSYHETQDRNYFPDSGHDNIGCCYSLPDSWSEDQYWAPGDRMTSQTGEDREERSFHNTVRYP